MTTQCRKTESAAQTIGCETIQFPLLVGPQVPLFSPTRTGLALPSALHQSTLRSGAFPSGFGLKRNDHLRVAQPCFYTRGGNHPPPPSLRARGGGNKLHPSRPPPAPLTLTRPGEKGGRGGGGRNGGGGDPHLPPPPSPPSPLLPPCPLPPLLPLWERGEGAGDRVGKKG